ncbi:hypothetical protein Pme01_50050 [Planosporangium mesophilum]|uniref:Uncharacterized protein n=1 Tax=Planosporangium mesophilum TaxID=689768 RepID=A0A8J3TFB4_9ACTN|nr:hypothetical protein Pme01_50050 [Planosporangium mesophilum]
MNQCLDHLGQGVSSRLGRDTRSHREPAEATLRAMADAHFEEPRLAAIYDPPDPDRGDLDA